jgi:deoxycytidylate deaminase
MKKPLRIFRDTSSFLPSNSVALRNPLVNRFMSAHGRYPKCISIAGRVHEARFEDAELFLRYRMIDGAAPGDDLVNELMQLAADSCRRHAARVGATVLTKKGEVFCATELRANPENRIELDFSAIAAAWNKKSSAALIDNLVDFSTSVHAEVVALINAISLSEIPEVLVVTRMPCLSCCRLIRLLRVPHTFYVNHRNARFVPEDVFLLMDCALCGMGFSAYQGKGDAHGYK